MAQDKVPQPVLDEIYKSFFDVLSHRRTRRISPGLPVGGLFKYDTKKQPEPLSKAEVALLCYAAAGHTGIISYDLASSLALTTFHGRSFPSPANSQRTQLLFTNDEGVFLYKPKPSKKVFAVDKPEDLQTIIDNFDNDVVKLQSGRLVLPPGAFSKSNSERCNVPGQTLFMPIMDTSDELLNALIMGIKEGSLYVTDDGKPAGVDKYIDKLNLKLKVPLPMFEQYIAAWISQETGLISQNLLLAAESMGLGGFPFSAFTSLIIMGGTPVAKGLGFRFIMDKKGRLNPIGIDGQFEGYSMPYWKDFGSIVKHHVNRRYAEGGAYNAQTASTLLDQQALAKFAPQISDDVINCASDLCTFIFQTYGKFPSTIDTMMMPVMIGVHHVDLDFYSRFHKPELINARLKDHNSQWHK
jgi:hypothetical protein